jgi:hypothetical protein
MSPKVSAEVQSEGARLLENVSHDDGLLESGSRGSAGTVTSPGDRLRILSARPPTADGGRRYRHEARSPGLPRVLNLDLSWLSRRWCVCSARNARKCLSSKGKWACRWSSFRIAERHSVGEA